MKARDRDADLVSWVFNQISLLANPVMVILLNSTIEFDLLQTLVFATKSS